jgi:UDP-N-acetylmuramate dehydrogenase
VSRSFDAYRELSGLIDGSVYCDELMARHTSYHIGGPADLFVECATLHDITQTFKLLASYGMPWAIVGKGSNLLVSDDGFRGAVITLGSQFKGYIMPDVEQDEHILVAGGGVLLSNLVQNAFKNGMTGLEFAVGVPGTLGGATFMNAGTKDACIGDVISHLTVIRPEAGLIRYDASELPWQYRSSGLPIGDIVLEVAIKIEQGNIASIRAKMEAALNRRKASQPLTQPSAGSVFKNPGGGLSAANMIDSLGLKGFSRGNAEVSTKHANFIVNTGDATAADVLDIIIEVQRRVEEEYGTELTPEIRFLGFQAQDTNAQPSGEGGK